MRTIPLSEAQNTLSALVDEAVTTHEIVQITKHGRPAAVLMSAQDLESLRETLFWLQQPGIRDDLIFGDGEYDANQTFSARRLVTPKHAR